jgi:hypothetical protein
MWETKLIFQTGPSVKMKKKLGFGLLVVVYQIIYLNKLATHMGQAIIFLFNSHLISYDHIGLVSHKSSFLVVRLPPLRASECVTYVRTHIRCVG